ncbi:MAG TPA: CheR family methyltransferase [Streptosporangiaceae bacterium]|nr:CheR family methyltransferase [Streptosporangiaceae bacterium]
MPGRIADLIRRETGVVLPVTRETAIMAAVAKVAPGLDLTAFLRAASGDPDLVRRLIDELTVQETAFVRDRAQFDEIAWDGLRRAALAGGSQTIRVWSAGCASGEEAYTLALLAAEAFAPAPPPVDVLGTDVSGAALAAATAGQYRERAVRGLEPSLRQRYLDRQADGSYLVGRRLRALVRFRRHNLVRDPAPPPGESRFDLVVCRNVLIYFDPPTIAKVIESLKRSLRPPGVLLLGAADALHRTASEPVPDRPARSRRRPEGRPAGRQPARRPPPAGRPPPAREERLAAALDAAGNGDRDGALAQVGSLLGENALDADAHFVAGLVGLGAGRPAEAVAALRRALFADPSFGLAAFTLGRAYDELGDTPAARRSYQLALRTLDPADDRHRQMLQQVEIGDITAACRVRLSRAGAASGPAATGGSVLNVNHLL